MAEASVPLTVAVYVSTDDGDPFLVGRVQRSLPIVAVPVDDTTSGAPVASFTVDTSQTPLVIADALEEAARTLRARSGGEAGQ